MLVNAYANHLTLAGYRPTTISSRRKVLTAYENSLQGTPLHSATRLHVEAFLARDLAPESRRAYRSHLRAFYAWAVDEGYAQADPTEKVPPIRVTRGLPRPMTDRDFRRALDTATPRMRAWLLLMALAGLRCMEVSALRPEDIQMGNGGAVLFLRECKGGGQAVVPVPPGDQPSPVAPAGPQRRALVDDQPRAAQPDREHAPTSERDRLDEPRLRHRAATCWFEESGHDLLLTSELMRHASVQTTQIYTKLDAEQDARRSAGGRAAATFGVMTYEVQTVRKGTKPAKDLLNEGAAKGWRLVSAQVDDTAVWLFWEVPS